MFAQPQENLTMQLGGTAQFDTRVAFIGGGAQQRKQKVNLLQLFKDGRQVYRCHNWSVYANSPYTSQEDLLLPCKDQISLTSTYH